MNRWTGSGNLGADIDVRYKEEGKVEGSFDIALNEYVGKDPVSGEAKYETIWIECVIKDRRAQTLQDELYLGRHVTVSGRLRTSKWKVDDKNWVRYTYVLVEEIDYDRRAVKSKPAAPKAANSQ